MVACMNFTDDVDFIKCSLANVDPVWNGSMGMHTMKFHDVRVTQACEGNFMLKMEAPDACLTKRGRYEVRDGPAAGAAYLASPDCVDLRRDIWQLPGIGYDVVLQCGRCETYEMQTKRPGRLNVDFRAPLSPLQAFALCLANSGINDVKG